MEKIDFVGLFGLSFTEEGMLSHQFRVVGKVNDQHYILQYFSWIAGDYTFMQVVSIGHIVAGNCQLYDKHEDWIHDSEALLQRQRSADALKEKKRTQAQKEHEV